MTYETYKDSRSRSYVPFLPFSLFVLVQQDDGVVVVPPPGGAGVCGGSDREWMYESVGYNVCLLVLSAAQHSPRARSFDLEVTPWAPTRLASCIFHPGPTEAYEPLRSTLCPARAPFHHLAAPESTRKPLLHTRGISRARSFDLEVTPWAPTRLTSCIFHPGPEESYGASTLSQTAQARP